MSLALVTNKSYAPCEDAVDGDDCENQSERYNCTFQPLALPGSSVPVPLITLTDFGHKVPLAMFFFVMLVLISVWLIINT